MMGGLARRAAAIENQRKLDPGLLLFSAGDFYAKPGIVEIYRSRFISEVMIDLGYTAVAPGERELSHGLRAIKEDSEAGLPVICANLFENGTRVFPQFIVAEVEGIKVGITALLDDRFDTEPSVEIRDPLLEGSTAVSVLKGRCDYLVLLAHMSRDRLYDLLSGVDGIDLVIRGHARIGEDASDDCADIREGMLEDAPVPVLFAGEFGKAIGLAGFSYDASGRVVLSDTTLVKLTKEMESDPGIAARVSEFSEAERVRMREANLSRYLSRDNITGKISERFLGMETCARCHPDIMADFMVTEHFRAFTLLTITGKETDPSCLPCHTTGYGLFSGYDPVEEQKGGINLQGVQCEACHGQGTKHSRDGRYRRTAITSCRVCHTATRSPDFSLDEYMERFDHCAHSRLKDDPDDR